MKNLILTLIDFYQNLISPLLHQFLGQKKICRYELSCSEYAKRVILKHGVLRGGKLAFARLISCQPFTKTQTYANI